MRPYFGKVFAVAIGALLLSSSLLVASDTDGAVQGYDCNSVILSKLHSANQQEISLGQLALTKTKTPDIRQYAQMLIDDHTTADKLVTDLAAQENISLLAPTALTAIQQAQAAQMQQRIANLNTLEGDDFDHEFLRLMVDGHTQLLQFLTEQCGKELESVRNLVTQLEPTIVKHRDEALALLHP